MRKSIYCLVHLKCHMNIFGVMWRTRYFCLFCLSHWQICCVLNIIHFACIVLNLGKNGEQCAKIRILP